MSLIRAWKLKEIDLQLTCIRCSYEILKNISPWKGLVYSSKTWHEKGFQKMLYSLANVKVKIMTLNGTTLLLRVSVGQCTKTIFIIYVH